jgi:hypothetical protein
MIEECKHFEFIENFAKLYKEYQRKNTIMAILGQLIYF